MALAENHRTALRMEASTIAAAAGNSAEVTNGDYAHHGLASSDHGNRCRHQYSDMLDQVYTSHMHAKFQLQQQQQQQQQHHHQQLQQQHKMFAQHQGFLAGNSENYSGHLSQLEHFSSIQKDKVRKMKADCIRLSF